MSGGEVALVERLRDAVTYQYMPMAVRRLLSEAATALAPNPSAASSDWVPEALRRMVYETTHLSPCKPNGDHDCTIKGETLAYARAALAAPTPPAAASEVVREAALEALRRWHRDSCYPDAQDFELVIGLNAVLASLSPAQPDIERQRLDWIAATDDESESIRRHMEQVADEQGIKAIDPPRLSSFPVAIAVEGAKRAFAATATHNAEAQMHTDDQAVDLFAAKMKAKLAAARGKGRGGWDDPTQCSVEHLQSLFFEHVRKGDPVDVANFCMMLDHYGASTNPYADMAPEERLLATADDLVGDPWEMVGYFREKLRHAEVEAEGHKAGAIKLALQASEMRKFIKKIAGATTGDVTFNPFGCRDLAQSYLDSAEVK